MTHPEKLIILPTRAFIAIEIVLDIAWHAGGKLVSSTDITNRAAIARRSLEPILQELTRAQILAGVRGPHGGYRLARERRNITVGMILQALLIDSPSKSPKDGADKDAGERGDHLTPSTSPLSQKVILPMWQDMSHKLWQELAPLTIEQLCQRAEFSVPKESLIKSKLFSPFPPAKRAGNPDGGMGGSCPPYKFAVFLLNTKQMRQFIRGVYTPRAPRLGSQPRQSRRGGNGGDQFDLFRPSLMKLARMSLISCEPIKAGLAFTSA